MVVALTNGEVLLLILAVAIPAAAISFAGAGAVYKQIGKGQFSLDRDEMMLSPREAAPPPDEETVHADREAEVHQMLEAKAYRQRKRGEQPIDVASEAERLLTEAEPGTHDPELLEEVRQLVIARNHRRANRGEAELDVEAEVARQLRELENLGQ